MSKEGTRWSCVHLADTIELLFKAWNRRELFAWLELHGCMQRDRSAVIVRASRMPAVIETARYLAAGCGSKG